MNIVYTSIESTVATMVCCATGTRITISPMMIEQCQVDDS